ncbi:MAG: hypothetical protein Q9159_006402 [Coniocarpon cinnabarinum]
MPTAQEESDLKAALWASIGALVDSLCANLPHSTTPTSKFIGALNELVYAQIKMAAEETEAFARHAGRTTVTKEDALMLARRNESLEGVLKDVVNGAKQ